MSAIEFVQNYSDLSTDQGYQFKFHCDRCGNGFMSSYVTNKIGMAGGFLRAAGGLLGGVLGSAGNSAYEVQRAVGGSAHDKAVREAVEEIKPLFNQCRRCGKWTCKEVCWNQERGMCKDCAPVLAEEVASAQANAARSQVQQKAMETDQTQGVDITQQAAISCPHCGAEAAGGKFCASCGGALMAKAHCTECGAKMAVGAKFCPECGTKT